MSNTTALMDLLFAGTRQRALAVLLLQPGEGFHLRELARLTASNAGTLMRELDKLTEAGLVLRSEHGNQVRYQANRACPMFEDLAAIFRKTHGAAAVLREALSPLASKIQVALVFGSVARGAQSSGSDIDLLVVGEVGFAELVQALYPAQQTLGREINPVLYSPAEFVQRTGRGEAFVREITGKPVVFLMGDKDDLAELAGNPPAATVRR
ncbi:nucleotidyltransferase domain-containing protein [Thermomonas sp.]|uniref:nucleotidyltransferase domain-containing protein n=1 Tax=Thermomonas sp. TaxID=1971895 RepID=UPI001ED07F25|nr:nucleotidyltransferase domain-containing protein [Thermomonas sp.]MBK6416517.1 nucleotidyltransferase domain-containing protein [Thermomonas sp.]